MNDGVLFHSAARREVEDAALWYERQRPGLGSAFLAEVDRVIGPARDRCSFLGNHAGAVLAKMGMSSQRRRMSVYSEKTPKVPKEPPHYTELVEWWKCWPQARPELLDFWARGGYVNRLLHRRQNDGYCVTVAVRLVDEIEHALKRMILLGVEVDLVWTGDLTPPVMNIAPLDIDYEGPGG